MNQNIKKILIIGGLGYLGSLLAKKLIERDYSIILYDALLHRQNYQKILQEIRGYRKISKSLIFIKGDTRHKKFLKRSIEKYQPDLIFHFGEIVGIYACDKNPKLTRKVNFRGSKNVVDLCAEFQVPLIYNSSSSVYGNQKHNRSVKENVHLPPATDNYCKNKSLVEHYIQGKLKYHYFPVIIFRPATVCGLAPRMRLELLPNHFTYCAIAKKKIRVSRPNLYRAVMDINDLINAYLKVIEKGCWKQLIYNIGHYNLSKIECAKRIQKIIPCQIILDQEVGDKRNLQIDCSVFEKEFSYQPKIKIEDSIRNIARWIRKHQRMIEKNNYAGILNTDLKQWRKMI